MSLIFIPFFFSLLGPIDNRSDIELSKAFQILQSPNRKQALPYLIKAFQFASDKSSRKEIAELYLEAAPTDDDKRDSFLRFLLDEFPEAANVDSWLIALADFSFLKADLPKAKSLYQKALTKSPPDKNLLEYKLAWVEWNLKDRESAAHRFQSAYRSADASLKNRIMKDFAKLWWNNGALDPKTFGFILDLPAAERSEWLEQFWKTAPLSKRPDKKDVGLLEQLKANPKTQKSFLKHSGELFFSRDPCFLFRAVLKAGDEFSLNHLLACLKFKQSIPLSQALSLVIAANEKNSDLYQKLLIDLLKHASEIDFRNSVQKLKPADLAELIARSQDGELILRLYRMDASSWGEKAESFAQQDQNFSMAYQNLKALKATQIPNVFSESFVAAYQKWLMELDSNLKTYNLASSVSKSLGSDFFRRELAENIVSLERQIERVQVDSSLQGLESELTRQKIKLKKGLRRKYRLKSGYL